jgi:excisionase family DNA binding protein
MDQEPRITIGEASRRLEVSHTSVQDWADTGKLPCERLANGTRVFRVADVERLRRDRERQQKKDRG